jgi:hypothetical protein
MAAWSAPIALSKFNYNRIEKSMSFTSTTGTYFWSNGVAWGTCHVEDNTAKLTVLYGQVDLKKFELAGIGSVKMKDMVFNAGESKIIIIK